MTTSLPQDQTDSLHAVLAALEREDSEELRRLVQDLHPADVGDLLEGIPPEQRHEVWHEVDPKVMGEVLLEVPEAVRADLLQEMDHASLITGFF